MKFLSSTSKAPFSAGFRSQNNTSCARSNDTSQASGFIRSTLQPNWKRLQLPDRSARMAVRDIGRFKVDLERLCAALPCKVHEACCGIDLTRCPDGNEEVTATERLFDLVHMRGIFAKPDDIGPAVGYNSLGKGPAETTRKAGKRCPHDVHFARSNAPCI